MNDGLVLVWLGLGLPSLSVSSFTQGLDAIPRLLVDVLKIDPGPGEGIRRAEDGRHLSLQVGTETYNIRKSQLQFH